MLTAARQLKYLESRLDSVAHKLEHMAGAGVEMEELHTLRVDLKKIKALLYFASRCHDKPKIWKDYRFIKPLFRSAGALREPQIVKKIMQQASPEIPEEIDRQIQEKTRNFSENINEFQDGLKKFRSKAIAGIADIDLASAVSFFERQKKKIRKEVLKHDPGKHWHEARKRMKIMMYMLSILPKKAVSEIGVNHKELDRIQELLGDWHDLEVLNQLYSDGNKAFAAKTDTHKLERQIRAAVEEL